MPVKWVKCLKHKISPWITNGTLKSIQYRDNLYKNPKMADHNTPEFDIQNTNLGTYKVIMKPCSLILKMILVQHRRPLIGF